MASRIRNGGFTLVELLVVIGIIAILAGLIFPALGRAKSRATRISCLSNYRQLTLAFMSYVDDANGYLPPNETEQTGGRDGLNSTARTWVRGNAYADSTPTNVQMGVLFPYNQSVAIYRCPSDRSSVRDERRIRRTRSVSMNMFLNTVLEPSHPLYSSCWHRVDQILHPPPSNVFVFIDEHEDSIDNARFAMAQPDRWTCQRFHAPSLPCGQAN